MKRALSLSVFFPAYNEEDNIAASVRAAETVLEPLVSEYEIIIVDDGSRDKTGEMADRLARENEHVRVVHHRPNQGYGGALVSGIKAARYDYVFFTDADLQFDLSEIEKLLDFVPEYEVVLGYRAKRRDPFMRLVNAKGWNLLNRLLFGLRVKDIDCAFKLFKREVVADLPLKTRGAMLSAEMLIRMQKKGIVFKEVPVTHLPRTQGVPTGANPHVIARAFRELLGLYKSDFRHENVTALQVMKFGAVGVVNTLIDLLSYVGFTRLVPFFSEHLLFAKAISFFLGTLFSFNMNRRFTFGSTAGISLAEVVRFYSSVGLSVFINLGSLYLFHEILGLHDLIAVALATVLTFAWGFIFAKFWVYRHPPRRAHRIVQA